jgi:magnesium transporter
MEDQDLLRTFRILPKDLAAETFVEMSNELKETLIHKLSNKELKEVMDELFLDDVVDLVEEMPANVVKRIISQNDAETRKYINEILKYPEDSAGSVMTIEYVSLRPKMSVRQALDSIREKAIDKETIYVCYVTDLTKKLIGVVTVKDLLIHKDEEIVEDIMNQNVIYAFTEDDKESVARTISKYGFLALPIVDRENRLVGIVTVDDAIDVLQEESTEDLSMMAAIVPSDKTYLELSPFEIWKQRIPWLLFLLISATFTGLIISAYESKLNAISTLLFACVPMMMGTGGNSGSQASVTVISGLATNELSLRDWLRITWKEFRVSILLGFTLAVACFVKLLLIDKLIFGQPYTYMICFVVSLALFFTVVVAKIIGALLPILAKVLKLDPAVVASPFITTIVDAVSLILYCLLAIAIL